MPNKIYDIKPPKTSKKEEKELEEFLGEEKKKRKPALIAKTRKEERRSIKRPVYVGVLIALLVVCIYLFFKLPKADVIIWPKVDTLSFQQTATADKSVSAVDTAKSVIPAQYFESIKTESQDFPATGNASNEGQASGTITIYNKSDPLEPLSLRSGTHFMSDSGKLFVSSQKVVIPAAKKSGSKIIPGSIQVKIQAVEGGTDYNIPPSNFSVPGLKGTSYYYSVYGVSSSAMTGGYAGKVKKVTDDDIQRAKDVLTKKTTSDAISDLKSQISSDYLLLDNAIVSNVASASTQTKSGTVASNFFYQATVKASALAFKKSDIDQLAKQYMLSQLPNGKTLLDSNFKNDYSASKINISEGKATLDLNLSSGVYESIDKNSLALSLMGENSDQIKATINNTLDGNISQVKINFWPFWVSSAPNNQEAIHIQLEFQ